MRLIVFRFLISLYLCALANAKDLCEGKTRPPVDPVFLIPKSATSCLRKGVRSPYRMNKDDLELLRPIELPNGDFKFSKILKFPGCFELSTVFEVTDDVKAEQVIMYQEFNWKQAFSKKAQTLDIECTGYDSSGCGGTGNRCAYCDICETIKDQNKKLDDEERFEQECPTEAGRFYDYREDRCVNDWGSMDEDCDGKPDFMDKENIEEYEQLLDDLKVEGYGQMELTVKVGQKNEKDADELKAKIQAIYKKHGVVKGYDIALQARRDYYKEVVDKNQIACVKLFFNVCKSEPIEDATRVSQWKCDA